MTLDHPEITIKQYRQYKLKLKSLEQMNYDAIIMIPCSGHKNWHEMADHSALIYYYDVCKILNRKVKFYADSLSVYDQYDIGYVRSLGVDSIRANLKRANLYKSETNEGELIVFHLNKKYSKETIRKYRETEIIRRENNLSPKPTGTLNPALYQVLAHSAERLHKLCNKHLDKLSSQTIGADIVRLSDGLLENYHQLTMIKEKEHAKVIAHYTDMRKALYTLIIKIRILGETNLWNLETCAGVTDPIVKARDLVEKELLRLTKKEDKKDTKKGDQNETR